MFGNPYTDNGMLTPAMSDDTNSLLVGGLKNRSRQPNQIFIEAPRSNFMEDASDSSVINNLMELDLDKAVKKKSA